jgi:hypothetical protein
LARLRCGQRHQLVNQRSFSWNWAQQAPDALHVFPLTLGAANDNGNISFRYIDALVQNPRADERI